MLAVIAVAMVGAAMSVSEKMHPATKQENHDKKPVCNHPAHIELRSSHRLDQTESFVGCLALTSELCLPSQGYQEFKIGRSLSLCAYKIRPFVFATTGCAGRFRALPNLGRLTIPNTLGT
jgi:hypothetical protein